MVGITTHLGKSRPAKKNQMVRENHLIEPA